VGEAFELMQKYHIENLPIIVDGKVTGSISESGLFNKMMNNGQDIRNQKVSEIAENPYPVVAFDTPVAKITSLISKDNGAVLAKDDTGAYHIVTKYDVIKALGN
jgi:cystathionine beta-synthase